MADTDTETLPNGTGGLSAAEEEDERLKQRPADIDADVREMERRKRVEALMSSKLFREELERVLDQQMNEGADAPLLQRIKEMVGGRLHTGSMRGPSCVLPINDIRGIEGVGYEKGEKILRCKLAAVYRLVDLFGWTQTGQGSQITARLNTAVEQVLTTPRGLLPHEVTASSLVKVDMQGTVQDQGTTNFPVNVAGFSVHASVHAARPDIRCVLHIRSPAALAISAMKNGLLPLSTEAALLGDIAYHHVPTGVLDNEERDKMVRVLGPTCKLLFITSNGALCCGETLEEAFYQAKNLTAACEVQLRLASLPLDSLILIDDDTKKQIYDASRKPPAEGAKWRVGGEEFEALMRMLDNAGFRTGYIYRHPLIKNDVPKPKSDVEVPPAVSSLGYLLEEEEMYKQGLWKKGQGKVGERTRWLNSPNVYQKVEVLETGTSDPKKITKWVDANNEEWVQDGSPAHSSTPVKIDTLQFVPMKTNPKEFKALQQQIKDNRRADKISAGPQSHILEGVTWDEANKLNQQAEDASHTHTGDHVVLMGAASKGIIQRGYQHNATVYSAPYARNPFDHVTDRDIDDYRRTVERRQRGDYDTDLSESEAISAAQVTSPLSETEEESRDEHRVLRIETKQAPVRSQPEVVLSDVDTTDFLHAERIHAERTKGSNRDPNLLSDDEVFLDSAASTASSAMSPVTSPVTSPVVVVRHQRVAVQHNVIRGPEPASNVPAKPQAPKPITNPVLVNKRTQHDYPRNTNFDNIVKIYDSPESSPLDDKKTHPKCKVSLHSRLLSSNESVRADALDLYQPGHGSSRSSLYSIPSLEWDGRKSEFLFKTRSLPRQSRKTNKARLFRTNSHAGFINSFVKDPQPMHYHLPRCSSCGATNNSYAWELSKSSLSLDSVPQKFIDDIAAEKAEETDVVKVKHKVVPVFKVAEVIKENEGEFVESQEFTEDCYFEDMQSSYSSDNLTAIEKTPAILDGLKKQLQKLSPVDDESKKVYNEVVIELKRRFDENCDLHRAELALVDAGIINDVYLEDTNKKRTREADELKVDLKDTIEDDDRVIDKINSMETMHGDYLNLSDDIDFTQAIYESPVKDLVDKDIRDYSVPINLYYEDYGKEDSKISPRKVKEMAKGTILEPILEESKSSYGDASNLTHGDESGKENSRISETSTDKPVPEDIVQSSDKNKDFNDTPKTGRLEITKETTNDVSTRIVEEIIDDIYHQDLDNKTESKNISKNILNEICDKALKASQLKEDVSKPAEDTKLTCHVLETAYIYNRTQDYFVLEEGSDVTNFNIENVTHTAVETAMEMYPEEAVCQETEVLEDQESIIDSVYENIFEIFSKEAVKTESIGKSSSESEVTEDSSPQLPAVEDVIFNNVIEKAQSVMTNHLVKEVVVVGDVDNFLPKPQISDELDYRLSENNVLVADVSGAVPKNTDTAENSEPQHDEFEFLRPDVQITGTTEASALSSAEVRASTISEENWTKIEVNPKVSLISSRGYSLGSTIPEMPSFNATVEFEKYEAVSEVIGIILDKIDYSDFVDIDLGHLGSLKRERNIKYFDSSTESKLIGSVDVSEKFAVSENTSVEVSKNIDNVEPKIVIDAQTNVNVMLSDDFFEKYQAEKQKNAQFPTNNKTRQITEKMHDGSSTEPAEYSLQEGDSGTFSMAAIVQHFDNQIVNMNNTLMTDSSSQPSESEKIVEAVIYYVFQRTYSLIANKATADKKNKTKKVVTVVDVEDVLYTAKPLWESLVTAATDDEAKGIDDFYTITPMDNREDEPKKGKLLKDCQKIECLTRNEETNKILQSSLIEENLLCDGVAIKTLNEVDCHISNFFNMTAGDEETSREEFDHDVAFCADTIIYKEDIRETKVDLCGCQETDEGTEDALLEADLDTAFNFTEIIEDQDSFPSSPERYAQTEELITEAPRNKELKELSKNVNNESCERIEVMSSEPEIDENLIPASVKSVVSSVLDEDVDDQVLYKMLKELRNPENTFMFVEPTKFLGNVTVPFSFESRQPVFFNKDDIFDEQKPVVIECVYSILEEILEKIAEENSLNDESDTSNEELKLPAYQLNETFIRDRVYHDSYQELDIYEDIEQSSTAVAQDLVNEFFDSFVANEMSFDDNNAIIEENLEIKRLTDDTFVLQTHEQNEALNRAFVENSRFSSPVHENYKIFHTCDESPIVNTAERFHGDDLSVLYEKEDLLMGSPFIKRNSVISMSQSFHSGGMKYWVSFDENLTENPDKTVKGPMRRYSENSTPSFIAVNFNKHGSSELNFDSRTSCDDCEVKRVGVLCENLAQPKSKSDEKSLHSMATNDSYHTACASKSDSFKTCEGYKTPIEDPKTKLDIPQKVLLYDNSKDSLHTRVQPYRRQYSSWPPFEETLFYRLISRFRMSESFDPSDLENCDSS